MNQPMSSFPNCDERSPTSLRCSGRKASPRQARRILSCLVLALCAFGRPGLIYAQSDEEVLRIWSAVSGSGLNPELVSDPAGETRIEWRGSVTLDRYNKDASGGQILTPYAIGQYFRTQAQTDLRGITPDGRTSYFQLMVAHSDDRATQLLPRQIGLFKIGKVGQDFQLEAGDILPNYSNLGTRMNLRGLFAHKVIEQTTLSFAAGLQTPSWEAIGKTPQNNTQYQREAYAMKLEHLLSPTTRVYFTTQGARDLPASVDQTPYTPAPTRQSNSTVGIGYLEGTLNVQAEVGVSRWDIEGYGRLNDRAGIIDAVWNPGTFTLMTGYHYVGQNYRSLSMSQAPGVEEVYVNGNWPAAAWLALTTDVRHVLNNPGGPVPSHTTTNALTNSATFRLPESLPAWSLRFNQMQSYIDYDTQGGEAANRSFGGTLAYSKQTLNTSFGVERRRFTNDLNPFGAGRGLRHVYTLGKMFSNATPEIPAQWTANINLTLSQDAQTMDSGSFTRNRALSLMMSGQRVGWGTFNLSFNGGQVRQPNGAPDLLQRGYQLDFSHPFGTATPGAPQNILKLYAVNTLNNIGQPALEYRERKIGVQATLAF